jgi:NAD-dependent SIR2 family protein deacetylase
VRKAIVNKMPADLCKLRHRVQSSCSLLSSCGGDLDTDPEPEDGDKAGPFFVLSGLEQGDSLNNTPLSIMSSIKGVNSAPDMQKLIRAMPTNTGPDSPTASTADPSWPSPAETPLDSLSRETKASNRSGFFGFRTSPLSPSKSWHGTMGSPENTPDTCYSGTSTGLLPGAATHKHVRELAALLQNPSVNKVVVFFGAGASVESRLETYMNMEKLYFSVEAGRLVSHQKRPVGLPAFTYYELFGPAHTWQDVDELNNGISRSRFMGFKAVSDAFCADMVSKFQKAEPHQGYHDLVEVLAKWKAGDIKPGSPKTPQKGAPAAPASPQKPAEKKIMVATTNLDKLSVKAFQGVAFVHEMHGDIDYVREHRLPLSGAATRSSSPTKSYALQLEGSVVPEGPAPNASEGTLLKPLVMHFEEDYYKEVRCKKASKGQEEECDEVFTFRHMKPEIKEFQSSSESGTVVIEVGCSHRVRAVPALREALLKRGATCFVVNPTEKSARVKQRTLASQPMLMSKIQNLRVVPADFGDFASSLKAELVEQEATSPTNGFHASISA